MEVACHALDRVDGIGVHRGSGQAAMAAPGLKYFPQQLLSLVHEFLGFVRVPELLAVVEDRVLRDGQTGLGERALVERVNEGRVSDGHLSMEETRAREFNLGPKVRVQEFNMALMGEESKGTAYLSGHWSITLDQMSNFLNGH